MTAQLPISNLKPETVSMAEGFKKKIKINRDGVVEAPDSLYEDTLKDADLDIATVKKVQTHNANVVTALTLAVGEAGVEAMKKNSKIDVIEADFKAGRDSIGVVVNRSREVNDMKNAGEKITQYGATTSKYIFKGGSELKKVRQHLLAQAAEALSK